MNNIFLIDDTIFPDSADGERISSIVSPKYSIKFLNSFDKIEKFRKYHSQNAELVLLDLDLRRISSNTKYSEEILLSLIKNNIKVVILSALPTSPKVRNDDEKDFLSIWDAMNKGAITYIKKPELRSDREIVATLLDRCIEDPHNKSYTLYVYEKLKLIRIENNKGVQIAEYKFKTGSPGSTWLKETKPKTAQAAILRVFNEMATQKITEACFTDIYTSSVMLDKRTIEKLSEPLEILKIDLNNTKIDQNIKRDLAKFINSLSKSEIADSEVELFLKRANDYIDNLKQNVEIKNELKNIFLEFEKSSEGLGLRYKILYPKRLHGFKDDFNKAIRKKSKGKFVGNLLNIGEQGETGGVFKANIGYVSFNNKRQIQLTEAASVADTDWRNTIEQRLNAIEKEIREIKDSKK